MKIEPRKCREAVNCRDSPLRFLTPPLKSHAPRLIHRSMNSHSSGSSTDIVGSHPPTVAKEPHSNKDARLSQLSQFSSFKKGTRPSKGGRGLGGRGDKRKQSAKATGGGVWSSYVEKQKGGDEAAPGKN